MNPTRRSPILPFFTAALLTAFLLPFLPGCSRMPEDHARVAVKPGADFAERMASVQALHDQMLLADVADKLDEPQAMAAFAKKVRPEDSAELAADVGKMADRLLADQALDSFARREVARPGTRLLAVWRLADEPPLSELVKNTPDRRVRYAAANKLSEKTRNAERGKIMDLINEGKLLAEINGDSIRNLNLTLRKKVPHPLEVTIPAGSYFVSDNPKAQNMVSTAEVTITLRGNSQTARIPVACANKPKDIPGKHDSFTLSAPPNAGELEKLMAVLGRKSASYHTNQAAVWVVTDDADYDDLGSLRTVSQYTPRIPGVAYGTRSINEPEAAEAMRVCDEAGIDIKKKAIWRDREKILAGLKAGELKNWLKKFTGLSAPAHKENVTALAISRDGKLLASGDDSGEIKLWSLPDGAFVRALEGHSDNVDVLAISPDGKWLLSRGNDGSYMKLWRTVDGKLVKDAGFVKMQDGDEHFHAGIKSAAFGADGKWFVTGDNDGFIKLWSLPGGKLIKTLKRQVLNGEGISLDVFALSADGGLLATEGAGDTVKLWSLPDGAPVRTLEGHRKYLRFVAIGSDGKHLVSGSDDNVVKVWSLPDGALLKTLEGRMTWSAAVSPDGKLLAAANAPERDRRGRVQNSGIRVALWRLPEGEILAQPDNLTDMQCSAITPDNTLLATGDRNRNIKLWSLPDGKLIKTLEGG